MAPSEILNNESDGRPGEPLLPLNALRAFEAVARRGSVAAAARELGVTSGAVSQQIRLLEDVLKVRLLERQGRGVSLTVGAAGAAPALNEAFARLSEASLRLRQEAGSNARVRLGAPGPLAAAWLAPRLKDHEIDLIADPAAEDLDRFRLDLDIRYGPGPWPGYRAVRLMTESVAPAAAPQLMAPYGGDWRAALGALPLIHDVSPGRDPAQPDWRAWLERRRMDRPDIAAGDHYARPEHVVAAAAAGRGAALVRRSLAEAAVSRGELISLVADGVTALDWGYYILTPETRPAPRAARTVIDRLMALAEPFEAAGV
ncbi:LysR family transcriptional regulator [Alkalicaulis satelles]|uniref:LysR family transcriptional regulator n=1 Tax=Alkalicaulis satelles TaxID=2609175 RepID=A0A5M6ZGD1_9PROT|nr:LysR family transcriptional regulator [Alkalicaulis satelles]KAA5802168.1 LysR family transcriptional regulator [Alkalicaulis satelles]